VGCSGASGRSVEEHFRARGRGVARREEAGEYFTGRTRALLAWLEADRGGLCVVTGDPGSGKSAVLGWLVGLANRDKHDVAL
jgi:ABC-type lipoprotein export system ATPase subunit